MCKEYRDIEKRKHRNDLASAWCLSSEKRRGQQEKSRTKEGWKQPTRKHSGVKNEPTHFGKGKRGWNEEDVSQRVIMVGLGHNTRTCCPAGRGMSEISTDWRFFWVWWIQNHYHAVMGVWELREGMDWTSEGWGNLVWATVTHSSKAYTACDQQYIVLLP